MEALRSYLSTAMLAALVSAVCIQLADDRFRKYVKYLVGLCLLLVLTRPLYSMVSDLSDLKLSVQSIEDVTIADDSSYLELLGSTISKSVGDRVSIQYDLPRESVFVTILLNTAEISAIEIDSVDIIVTQECDETAIEKALSAELGCPVNVREEVDCPDD